MILKKSGKIGGNMKCKNCLTQKAINILNADFIGCNPYSRSQGDWVRYAKRVERLKARLSK